MKLEGLDGLVTYGPEYDKRGKMTALSLAHVLESERKLVGTKHYDVLHTTTFR